MYKKTKQTNKSKNKKSPPLNDRVVQLCVAVANLTAVDKHLKKKKIKEKKREGEKKPSNLSVRPGRERWVLASGDMSYRKKKSEKEKEKNTHTQLPTSGWSMMNPGFTNWDSIYSPTCNKLINKNETEKTRLFLPACQSIWLLFEALHKPIRTPETNREINAKSIQEFSLPLTLTLALKYWFAASDSNGWGISMPFSFNPSSNEMRRNGGVKSITTGGLSYPLLWYVIYDRLFKSTSINEDILLTLYPPVSCRHICDNKVSVNSIKSL